MTSAGSGFEVRPELLTAAATRSLPPQVSALEGVARTLAARSLPAEAYGRVAASGTAMSAHTRLLADARRQLAESTEQLTTMIAGLKLTASAIQRFDANNAGHIQQQTQQLAPDEILRRYQTPDDPNGMKRYPESPWDMLVTPRNVTATEARLLDDLSMADAYTFTSIKDDAYAQAEQRFSAAGQEDGHGDAFRHAYWNARLNQDFGTQWATDIATAHEGVPGNPPAKEAMDLHNNEIGRAIGIANPNATTAELADLVERAVRNGDTVVIDANGDLRYSDQVPDGGASE